MKALIILTLVLGTTIAFAEECELKKDRTLTEAKVILNKLIKEYTPYDAASETDLLPTKVEIYQTYSDKTNYYFPVVRNIEGWGPDELGNKNKVFKDKEIVIYSVPKRCGYTVKQSFYLEKEVMFKNNLAFKQKLIQERREELKKLENE